MEVKNGITVPEILAAVFAYGASYSIFSNFNYLLFDLCTVGAFSCK
jgi:hypothetical protein